MFRRVANSRRVVAALSGARTMVLLSESNPVLASCAKNLGYKSNVWVEEEDKYWFESLTPLKPGETAITATRPTRIELYNVNQLVGVTYPDERVQGHTSMKTNKRYTGAFAAKLDAFAASKKLDSKWWVSNAEVRKNKWQIARGESPFVMVFDKPSTFFNADQFVKPQCIQQRAFSGATGRAFTPELSAALWEHAESNGFTSAIYFTEKQLRAMGLDLIVGSSAASMAVGNNDGLMIYPLSAIEQPQRALDKMKRFPVDVPTYLISGKVLSEETLAKVASSGIDNPTRYWISKRELEGQSLSLAAGAKGVSLGNSTYTDGLPCFNLYQMTQPLEAMKRIGRFDPNPVVPTK